MEETTVWAKKEAAASTMKKAAALNVDDNGLSKEEYGVLRKWGFNKGRDGSFNYDESILNIASDKTGK